MAKRSEPIPVDAVLEVGGALSSSADLDEALANVVQAIGRVMDVSYVDIWTYARERGSVTHSAFWSASDELEPRDPACGDSSLGLDSWPSFPAVIEGREVVVSQVDDPELASEARGCMEGRGYKTMVDAPLLVGDEVVGILGLAETRAKRDVGEADRKLLAALCRFAAAGVHSAGLFHHKEDREGRLLALLKTSRSMAAAMSAQETIQGMRAEIATMLAGVTGVEVHLRADAGGFERFLPPPPARKPSSDDEPPPADPILDKALVAKRPTQARISGGRTRIVLPVVFKDEVTGYIDLKGRLAQAVSGDEVKFLQTLANQAAVALENARLARTVERQSAVDVVTGLHSRWYFFERLYSEVARSYRYKEPLGLVLIEVDGLERFRDVRGDKDADDALRAIARIFGNMMRRKVDIVCRYDRDQFAVLMPHTRGSSPGAALAAERLRATVEATEFRNEEHDILGRFTLSVGVGGYPHHADDGDELIEVTEKALAIARSDGNRVKLYAPYAPAQ